jgi:AcrR family transcriptional regulator
MEPDGRAAKSQRARILQAVVEVVAERGFAGAKVRIVTVRAGVSTRTFYEHFRNLEDCLVAILDDTLEQTCVIVGAAFAGEASWRAGLRGALAGMLAFFDQEAELARFCVLHTLAAGPVVLEHRERTIRRFRAFVVQCLGAEAAGALPLAFESTVASVIGMIQARLVTDEPEPLIVLLGPLMGLILAPYLNATELEAEIKQADERANAIINGYYRWAPPPLQIVGRETEHELTATLRRNVYEGWRRDRQDTAKPEILGKRGAIRARQCLSFLATQNQQGRNPSNREIATGIGVNHGSQISALLRYLLKHDLVVKQSEGPGKRNAWQVTTRGEEVLRGGADGSASLLRRRQHSATSR